jgi:uncharacterized protein YndB with AHSA1/START domain
VSKIQITTPSDREVVISRRFDAPRDLVFRAYTDPELLPKWCTGLEGWSMPVCEMPAVTGPYRWVFKKSGGTEEMTISGMVTERVPPERLVSTESWGPEWPETLNTVIFTSEGKQTLVTLTIRYVSKAARDAAIETGMGDGLEITYDRLEQVAQSLR